MELLYTVIVFPCDAQQYLLLYRSGEVERLLKQRWTVQQEHKNCLLLITRKRIFLLKWTQEAMIQLVETSQFLADKLWLNCVESG